MIVSFRLIPAYFSNPQLQPKYKDCRYFSGSLGQFVTEENFLEHKLLRSKEANQTHVATQHHNHSSHIKIHIQPISSERDTEVSLTYSHVVILTLVIGGNSVTLLQTVFQFSQHLHLQLLPTASKIILHLLFLAEMHLTKASTNNVILGSMSTGPVGITEDAGADSEIGNQANSKTRPCCYCTECIIRL